MELPLLLLLLLLLRAPLGGGGGVGGAPLGGGGGGGGGAWTPARLELWVRSGLRSLQWEQLEAEPEASAPAVYLGQAPPTAGQAPPTAGQAPPTAGQAPPTAGKVVAILPDSSGVLVRSKPRGGFRGGGAGPGSGAHDAVLVLDPSPGENFGHPVVLFYVDLNVTKRRCSHLDGIYLGEECLIRALKGRCQNQLKRRQTGPERLMGNGRMSGGSTIGGLCEVHFLPLVVAVGDGNRTQRLRCVDHADFAPCPRPLPLTSPSLPVSSCELNKNTRRCHHQPLATHMSCRLYQTCDHAVLISGGWRQQITFQRHVQNLQRFYKMLRNNGFHKDHIKTFFASSGQLPGEVEGVYAATEKEVIRNHVSYVCRKQHCADSLVLFLNSPTRSDGAMLLWDANLNGIADLKERYSANELLADLAGCRATRVLVFVDQSYSGVLAKRLRGSQKHLNVVLVQSQPPQNQNQNQNQNQRLGPDREEGGWEVIGPETCLLDHLRVSGSPLFPLNVTLAGAPCNATPPLTHGEIQREYQGCQNLPTALWHQRPT